MGDSNIQISDNIALHHAGYQSGAPNEAGSPSTTKLALTQESRGVELDMVDRVDRPKLAYGAVHRLAHILVEIARRSTTANDGEEAGSNLND